MNLLEVIILAIIQAMTEFLPVSSSGHLLAAERLTAIESSLTLDVVLHFGTLLALMIYFWPRIMQITKNVFSGRDYRLAVNIVLTSIPAAAIGFAFEAFFSTQARQLGVVIFMLALIGVIMLLADKLFGKIKTTIDTLKPMQALAIGVGQSLALVPGTSRSGITILTGRWLGLSNAQAAEYSFLAGIPVIFGATLKVLLDAETRASVSDDAPVVLAGVALAAVVGILVLRWMLNYLRNHSLAVFGWYRLALAALLFILYINQ